MQKRSVGEKILIEIPVRVVVHSLEDGSHISCSETTVRDVLFNAFVTELEQEIQGDVRELHELQKNKIEAYVRRGLLPKEAPDSPIYLSNTWIEVVIEGDVSTWKKKPYKNHTPTNLLN